MDQYADEIIRSHIAATKIQSIFRGYLFRYNRSQRNLYHKCAKIIQRTWRAFRDRKRIRRVIEILAMFRLSRAFCHYRLIFHKRKTEAHLHQFDELLGFYPSKTKDPVPKPRGRRRRRRGRGRKTGASSSFLSRNASEKKDPKKPNLQRVGISNTPRKPIPDYQIGGVPRNRVSLQQRAPARKKKIIVELPPPWHSVNPRRLSTAQKDDMIYDQKGNLAWARKELVPLLFRHCNPLFTCRDELRKRNQKFAERIVTKSFMCPIPRGLKSLSIKIPKTVTFAGPGCLLVVASSVGAVVLEPKSLTADNIIGHSLFDVDTSLLDVAISPLTGQVVGLDSHWVLHLFEHNRTIMTYELMVDVTVPKVNKYISFDRFGLFWVNLFPQRGNLYLFDTLSFHPTIQINLENLSSLHRFMRTNTSLTPLFFKDQPYGFVGIFSAFPEIYVFSNDFQRFRKLSHPDMKCFPNIKQINHRLYIWSKEGSIYVYDLKERYEDIVKLATIKMHSPPTDICGTLDPDMIYIACEDYTIHALLGKTTEHPLRLSTARMDRDEIQFCDILLGPIKFTKSRNMFREVAVHKFTWQPKKIAACVFSDKLTLITVTLEDSTISSVWMINDAQTCRCIDFDAFKYSKPEMSLTLASANFNDHVLKIQRKRNDFLDKMEFIDKFDSKANPGLMNNMFNPLKPQFPFAKFFMSVDMKRIFTFIPDNPPKTISVYEVYHYMKRVGLLPYEVSSFGQFLERFAPTEMKRIIPSAELVTNCKLPVKTYGYYSAMVKFSFDQERINYVIDAINPHSCLKAEMGKFTLSNVQETLVSKNPTRPRSWLSEFEKNGILDRHLNISILEDLVKTELMNRVQKNIDISFQKNQLNKMQPVQSIDIHQQAPRNGSKHITFSSKANRNPLLDENRHRCIYDSWSKYTLFGRDQNIQMFLRAIHVPAKVMSHASVQTHFELIRRVSHASNKVTSNVHSYHNSLTDETVTVLVVNEDIKALPLSHYLTIHSFLGGTARLISAVRSIFARILVSLYQLHKAGIIVRTVYPSNILLNATDLTVKIGSIYDCQQIPVNGRSVHLPLPNQFCKDTNPFLPPEYYHEPPRKYTTAFDVWQFGMTLLFVLTGYLPPSYGSELKKHLSKADIASDKRHVRIELGNELDDPPTYPHAIFFYDWLKGAPLAFEKERSVGDRGECFFTTKKPGKQLASILELDNYKLLPYKNTKINYDEERLFIEVIASCLQIDPEKRPTVEQLLCTYLFNQTSQITDIFDNYMKTPDPNIFVSQFFSPILNNLDENNFQFVIGIISSLMFYEDNSDEDTQFSFPLDTRATEQVITSLFQLKFVDQIVTFVLNLISKKISHRDVNPTVIFENDCFDSLHRFFIRFVSSVERGTGALLNHVDEVVMSLLAVYAASPHLRHHSSTLKASPSELFDFSTTDSAPVYVFTYSKMHSLVRYALESSPFILKSLVRTTEHSESYFTMFLSFSETVFSFSNALCSQVEKQRANLVKSIACIWANGESTSTVRLFLDFKVPQKIVHCFYLPSVRNEASSFICSVFRAIKLKSFDPTYIILQNVINVPTIVLHCSAGIRQINGNEAMRAPAVEIIRSILFGESAAAITSLVVNDIIWALAELAKDPIYHNLVMDAISFSSIFVMQIIMSSPHLQHQLIKNGIEFLPRIDYRDLTETLDLSETMILAKRLAATLYIRQSPLPIEMETQTPPVQASADFLVRAAGLALKECERLSRSIDNQVYDLTRFDLKGSTMLKAKSKAKEAKFANALQRIVEMCDVLQHLFRCLCFYWRYQNFQLSKSLFDYIKGLIAQTIPLCNSLAHPASKLHHSFQRMLLYCIQNMPYNSPVMPLLNDLDEIWPRVMHRDIMFVMQCVDKDITQMQLMERYPIEREIRNQMIRSLITSQIIGNLSPIFKVLVNEMLYNKTEFKFDSTTMLSLSFHFPMRSEAISIILFLLEFREKYESAAKQLVNELIICNFLDRERKMTEEDDNHHIVSSSILFMKMVTQCRELFNEIIIKNSKSLLESLCLRFSREILNVEVFRINKSEHKKPVQNLVVKEMWNKPLTALPKASSQMGNVKSARTPRPQSAFGSTKKSITVSKPITPR